MPSSVAYITMATSISRSPTTTLSAPMLVEMPDLGTRTFRTIPYTPLGNNTHRPVVAIMEKVLLGCCSKVLRRSTDEIRSVSLRPRSAR